MVIAGKIRGNAPQLGDYLFTLGNNQHITVLHLDGREDATPEEFKEFLYSVELNSKLTRSKNSAYHAYMNPNPEDTMDRVMTKEEWLESVDILTKQLNYGDQRHGAVLHDLGNGRIHAHIVYERYNHERGTLATYEDNYKAHDRARAEIEKKLKHKPTPQKNKNRDQHKQTLTAIWRRTATAEEFISEAKANGYKIAKGTDRPFRVVDSEGISFDLVRKLDGVKTAELKQRFIDTELPPDKQAILEMQVQKQQGQQEYDKPSQPTEATADNSAKTPAPMASAQDEARQKFLQNVKDVRERNRSLTPEITMSVLIALRVCFSFKENATEQRAALKQQFDADSYAITATPRHKPPDKMLGFIEAAQYYKPT
ncbi:relaxase/mobilization nuclease domain-containing protein [Mucilaginibacter psychrotolerans]|uniref:MobA/VirD2-like nuclease domain-containing protein n=1 Tax=Mucilaginibacter psychrotolerans TaxID=1524096 RepID=A0A4Y8SH11_9SPHI|nr:hypothetical protein [Mucilaginibacter psychrotolerans]TFF37925.1 hypothetical protein E2R66_10065 [Mucilaginibacter psychrotolerans]